MLFQDDIITRGILVFTVQFLFMSILLLFAYKLLKRARNKLTITCSAFLAFWAGGYMLTGVFFFIQVNPFAFIYYNLSVFLINVAHAFLVLFAYTLTERNVERFSRYEIIYVVVYAILAFLILLVPLGVRFGPETNWIPIFSWEFTIVMSSIYTIDALLPVLYFVTRVIKNLYQETVKKRMKVLLIGLVWMVLIQYPTMLYNTWIDNQLYRTFWSVFTYLNVLALISIYIGTIKSLD